jgi:AraC family transcriptional regulator
MKCTRLRVRHGDRLELDSEHPALAGSEPAILMLHGDGVRAQLRVGSGLASLWVAQRGQLNLETQDGPNQVEERRLRVASRDERPRLAAREGASWWGLVGNAAFWAPPPGNLALAEGLLPLPLVLDPEGTLGERLAALQRADGDDPRQAAGAAEDLQSALLQAQQPWLQRADACPGRSQAMRLQVLHRLMRVKLRIEQGEPSGIDLAELSRIASYSTCHLVRVFHRVFGVPPHEHVIRERMRRALHMLGTSRMAVAEVAQAVGVNNHSAFARQLRARLGCSASELRHRLRSEGLPAIPSRNAQRAIQDRAARAGTNS